LHEFWGLSFLAVYGVYRVCVFYGFFYYTMANVDVLLMNLAMMIFDEDQG